SSAAIGLGEPLGSIPLAELPGFAAPVVAGHGGELRLLRTPTGKVAAVFTGRTHFYEGRGVGAVVHGVRTAAAAGAKTIVLTNGCGGLNPSWAPGTPVLIRDHINLTGATPLEGATFIDLTEAYSLRLRELAREVDPTLDEGVYVQFRGPQYETPAEVKMAGILGGDLVGMSTTLETIAAREAGLEVLGISLVTNLGAGISAEPLDHAEVIAAGKAAEPRLRALLAGLLERL
ncbi:MAG: purine-nucleoside phosphorylase, partial [Propionibacteriaceae bacterium]|nr:purine-nucleoside phosphorylase [Propionibacteriaceae bacterium]